MNLIRFDPQVRGGGYRVVTVPDKEGSVLPDGSFSPDRKGNPGVWIKRVVDGRLESSLCPSSGRLDEILALASDVQEDPGVGRVRQENPDDSPGFD